MVLFAMRTFSAVTDMRIVIFCRFLTSNHESNWLCWNMCSSISNSGGSFIDFSLLNQGNVLQFPPTCNQLSSLLPNSRDLGNLSINQLFRVCYSMHMWMEWGESNVCVLFSDTILRSIIMCCFFMIYRNENNEQKKSFKEIFEYVSSKLEKFDKDAFKIPSSWKFTF
jgi:hypothetical protein